MLVSLHTNRNRGSQDESQTGLMSTYTALSQLLKFIDLNIYKYSESTTQVLEGSGLNALYKILVLHNNKYPHNNEIKKAFIPGLPIHALNEHCRQGNGNMIYALYLHTICQMHVPPF